MRVAFSDPQGTRLWRLAPYLGPAILLLLACTGLLGGVGSWITAVLAFGGAHLIGLIPFRQARLRPCDLATGPGYIELKNAGTRSQRIAAKSIVGGTTARSPNGILFTLQHANRDQPIALEVANDADAERIRHALGIGHGGFGAVAWRTSAGSSAKVGFFGKLITFGLCMVVVLSGLFGGGDAMRTAALLTANLAFITFILSLIGWFAPASPPSVHMTAEGLKVMTQMGWFTVPYDHVQAIHPMKTGLRFMVPPPYGFIDVASSGSLMGPGLGVDDREGLVRQILSAAARARGLGTAKQDVTGRVDALRRHGETPRDWLARLDMAGRMLESSVAGYRGHTLDYDDLWAILEDPEGDAELRAAAARVLRHSPKPETRIRIDAAVAAVRDETVNKRLRIAVNDNVDLASQELAMLDTQESQAPPRAMQR